MHIKSVSVKNFRNFNDVTINFSSGFQTVIGENNIGKSNLYRAIRIVLDKSLSYRDRYLKLEDFNGFLSEVTFEDYILISIEFYSENLAAFPTFHALKTGDNTARVTYIYAHKQKFIGEDDIPEDIFIEDYKWNLYGGGEEIDIDHIIEKCAVIQFRDLEGVNLYFITAFRNINADLYGGGKSLLSRFCQSRENAENELEDIKGILTESSEKLNELAFIPEIQSSISEKGSRIAGNYFSFPIALSFISNFGTDAWGQLNLFYNSEGQQIPINILGLGQKNVLYLTLFLAELENSSKPYETNILLIEEPEAHLHPQLQKVLFSNLSELESTQVFMTSHSTHIASDCEYKNLNVLFKNTSDEVQAFSPFTAETLNDREKQLLKRYLDATRSEMFFASAIFFVEGAAEQFILPSIAKAVYDINFTENNISVIPIHSRYFEPYLKLTFENNFEIPAVAIIDGDFDELEEGVEYTPFAETAKQYEVDERVFVSVGEFTLEIDLFPDAETNTEYLRRCFENLGHTRSYNNLIEAAEGDPDIWNEELIKRIDGVVKKGRFAQELSMLIDEDFVVPKYIENAIIHIADCKNIDYDA